MAIKILPAPGGKCRVVETSENNLSGYTVVNIASGHNSIEEARKAMEENSK